MPPTPNRIQSILEGSEIKKLFPDFEPRREQVLMAKGVEKALRNKDILLIEAGTGVGKSLAYLLPSILYSLEEGKKVVISTETIALQNQLIQKDIPMARKILGKEVKAHIALGASNYVCKRKLGNLVNSGNFPPEMTSHLKPFYEWEKSTVSGIRSEFKGFATKDFWAQVTREPETCLGKRCHNFEESFYFLEKKKWEEANILIVNHHLLASHIAGDFKVLPDFTDLILDEAHSFPEILGKAFAANSSRDEIIYHLQFIYQNERKQGLLAKIKSPTIADKLKKLVKTAVDYADEYFQRVISEVGLKFQSHRVTKPLTLDDGILESTLLEIANTLKKYKATLDDKSEEIAIKELIMELDFSIKKLSEQSEILELFRTQREKDRVYWIEPSKSEKSQFYSIHIQHLKPEVFLVNDLFPKMETIIFTSATLSTADKGFEYFKQQIGNPEVQEIQLDSPFPYEKNALLYIPKPNSLRDPSSDPDNYTKDIITLIPRLLSLTQGNAFILFTSNKMLKEVYESLKEESPYPLFSQEIHGPDKALQYFLETPESVLLGVSTFWQGVDIKGDKLRSVIITKLPFQPPGEPALEARIENLKKKGQNPFMEVQLPYATLVLKQGFGRLIRSKTDTGIVALLDPRVKTKHYGNLILDSLPPARKVFSFIELKTNLSRLGS
jgi:ATP-dependent DNA helicase DinG